MRFASPIGQEVFDELGGTVVERRCGRLPESLARDHQAEALCGVI